MSVARTALVSAIPEAVSTARAAPGSAIPEALSVERGAPGSAIPGRIRVISGITVAALALLFAALAITTASARSGLDVTGRTAGPQVVATADLYFALSDMDGQVATALLLSGEYGEQRRKALQRYDQRRGEAGRALLQASELAGDDVAGRQTIQDVLDGLGRYERLASQALLLGGQARYAPGPPPQRVLAMYRQATDLMRTQLLPQAYNLTLESSTIVRRSSDDTLSSLSAGGSVVVISSVLALGCLLWLQVFLARRFRRVLSPSLLVATAIAGIYAFAGLTVLDREADALLSAKRDGFDSVLTLARARAISNSMHADQTRYLLDPGRADTYESVYLDKAQSVLYAEAANVNVYHAKVAEAVHAYPRGTPTLGFLGTELSRQSPRGQPDSIVLGALANYNGLQQGDRRLRELTAVARDGEAVAYMLGTLRDEFSRYDATLVMLSDRSRTVFDRAVGNGEAALAGLFFLLPVAMISTAVLIVAGVLPRLNEYR